MIFFAGGRALAKQMGVAIVAIAAACLLYTAPARADIEVKVGCDGKWVERSGSGFETYKVCEHTDAEGSKRPSALRMRGHVIRKLAHFRPQRHVPVRWIARETPRHVVPVVVAAVIPPHRETECVALNCPQFMMVGVGY